MVKMHENHPNEVDNTSYLQLGSKVIQEFGILYGSLAGIDLKI